MLLAPILNLGSIFRGKKVDNSMPVAKIDLSAAKRLQAEMEELRIRTGYLRAVLETMGDAMVVTDPSGLVQMANKAAVEIARMPIEILLGGSIFEFIDLDDTAISAALTANGPPQRFETKLRRTDLSVALVSVAISIMRHRDLSPSGLVFLIHDLTGMRELQDQLLQAQKLEAVGTMAAGIAHEINTPIQYIGDNIQYLADAFKAHRSFVQFVDQELQLSEQQRAMLNEQRRKLDLDFTADEVPRANEQTTDGVCRVAKIVRSMKEFAHPDGEEPTVSDVNRLIESTVTISRNEWKYRADLQLDLAGGLPALRTFPGEFNQALLNLIVNAADAVEERYGADPLLGKIAIRSRQEGNYFLVEVEDNGTGIPERIKNKIFDPFFTTKAVGKGSGQGLAIVRSSVEGRLKGKVQVRSSEGVGTTMTILIPLRH